MDDGLDAGQRPGNRTGIAHVGNVQLGAFDCPRRIGAMHIGAQRIENANVVTAREQVRAGHGGR